jgi:hypothetical protein
MANEKTPELGDEVQCTITGFKGTVVCFSVWMNGCQRLSIQPHTLTKEGKPKDIETFDIQQLKVLKKAKKAETPQQELPGGPRPSPVRGRTNDTAFFRR